MSENVSRVILARVHAVTASTFTARGSTEAPIRVSYHSNIHYNAIIDPDAPTFGVGLGFSDLRPGVRTVTPRTRNLPLTC